MCDPISILATSVTALGQYQQGQAAKAQANYQAGQQDYQAKVEQDDALATAEMIRKAGRRQVGEANAAFAASGVKVGEGSAGEVDREIYQGSEHDAFMSILTGDRRARGLREEADLTRAAGKNAARAGVINAFGTVLGGGYSALRNSGWRTAGPGFSGTQAPAPVINRDVFRGYGDKY